MKVKAWPFALILGLAAALPAHAFRCGTKLVHEGDTRSQVISKCGEPTEIGHSSIWRRPVVWRHGRPFFVGTDVVEIPVEIWTYNLGPSKLMRRLRFESGIVVEIETLGYGFREH